MRTLAISVVVMAVTLLPAPGGGSESVAWAGGGVTFSVDPSGDLSGVTDWQNLTQAFEDAKAAGAGSVVELAAGDFYIDRPLVVYDFEGTFRGAGKDVTNLRNPPDPAFVFPITSLDSGPAQTVTFLPRFKRPEEPGPVPFVEVSDLSIHVTCPTELWGSHGSGPVKNHRSTLHVRAQGTGVDDPTEVAHFDVAVENVGFYGVNDPTTYTYLGYSANNGPVVSGELVVAPAPSGDYYFKYSKRIMGHYVIRGVTARHVFQGVLVPGPRDSVLELGGAPNWANEFYDIEQCSVCIHDASASSIAVSYQEIAQAGGISLSAGGAALFGFDLGPVPELMPELSIYELAHNRIIQPEGALWAGIELWHYSGIAGHHTMDLTIFANEVTSNNHVPPWGPLFSYFVSDAVVRNNRIDGGGFAGIYVEPYNTPGSGWLLLGNDVQNFVGFAPIFLAWNTSDCTVVGNSHEVADSGTNNTLVGVTPMGPGVGEAIQEAISGQPGARVVVP